MQFHLCDAHPTRLAYALMRIQNAHSPNSQQQATIVHFASNTQTELAHSPLTELQLNFMRPALGDASNGTDPQSDDDGLSIIASKKSQFIERQQLNSTNNIINEYNIMTLDSILSPSNVKSSSTSIPTEKRLESNLLLADENVGVLNLKETNCLDEYIQSEINRSAKLILDETGVEKDELFRCGFPNCKWPDNCLKPDGRVFLMHLSQHQNVGVVYPCFHCSKSFGMPIELKNHIKTHLKHRFFCYYCDVTGATQDVMNGHFENDHKNANFKYLPINSSNYDMASDLFVVCPEETQNITDFNMGIVSKVAERTAAKSYLPHEIDSIPKKQIFTEAISCGRCSYKTKVRTNLMRHLKGDCAEQHAPVNPVPCLNSSDRHSDKMKNLAASSNLGDSSIQALGKFIPETRRYICGAKQCQYQTISADMLQSHIVTLHEFERDFSCPHCGLDLSNSNSRSEIVNHLRFHDTRIFKCPTCPFIHYQKQQVEKHIGESHPNSKDRALSIDRPLKRVEAPKSATKTIPSKWMCNICSKIFNLRPQVKSHVSETHRLSHQFKCSICLFSHDNKTTVKDHLIAEHAERDESKIKSHFDKVENVADNSPIWRRHDPTRVS